MEETIFSKIIKGDIPSHKVYEDDQVIAILDINPVNKGHTLVIPKKPSRNFLEIEDNDLKYIIVIVKKIANALKNSLHADGVNIVLNNEKAAGQVIYHTHFHVIPRFDNDNVAKYSLKNMKIRKI